MVIHHLANKGVPSSRMEYAGDGFVKPLATNETEDGRQQNRHTEFKIISNWFVLIKIDSIKKALQNMQGFGISNKLNSVKQTFLYEFYIYCI